MGGTTAAVPPLAGRRVQGTFRKVPWCAFGDFPRTGKVTPPAGAPLARRPRPKTKSKEVFP